VHGEDEAKGLKIVELSLLSCFFDNTVITSRIDVIREGG
jgi:hypothetical protein